MANGRNYLPSVPKLRESVSIGQKNWRRHGATHVGDHLGVDRVLRKVHDGAVSSNVEDSIVFVDVDIRELFSTG